MIKEHIRDAAALPSPILWWMAVPISATERDYLNPQ
jgi:hypothetical protein